MADKILDIDWDDIVPGQWIRWITASFVRRGVILQKKGNSLRCKFDGQPGDTVIPNAKWYYDMISKHDAIVVIDVGQSREVIEATGNADDMVTPAEAAAILGTDSKAIRRKLRSGKLIATKKQGQWYISRSQLNGEK